ncbi:MAG TPA: SIS domain-containing protein [Propionicimonas sp.]|nr:SIS domain-containing protein [Propionicimonas sp.]HRA05278.1 SIS domain-containing protein [Propionicimonas sp.]
MYEFDDSRLEDVTALRAADHLLRPLAEAGARVRREAASAEVPLRELGVADRPRAMIIFGPEARLLRAVLEPTCPVPLVAWPRLGLPGWVGPLDIVVVMGGGDKTSLAAAFEAVRRGCQLLVVGPADSVLARESASSATTLLPTTTGDALAAAIVALGALSRLGLGPQVNAESIATAMDEVALESSMSVDATQNAAKAVALELADAQPLVWGGSILAARASRRVAEALRSASGRVVLSADAGALAPLLTEVPRRDPFADPFEESASDHRPGLVLVDDGLDDEHAAEERDRLRRYALAQDVLISNLRHEQGTEVERYVTVLQQGLFAAAYLKIGLGRA